MKIWKHVFINTLLIFSIGAVSYAQIEEGGFPPERNFKTGLGFEYFNRTVNWNDEENSSLLESLLFLVNAEYEINERISFGAILGYSLTSYEDMIFRRLPFSIEFGTENIGGYIFGGKFCIGITDVSDIEISGKGQFVYYIGKEKTWDIPDLAVSGTVSGKTRWMRLILGPQFSYRGFDYFIPHVFLGYDSLWGTFEMEQNIEALSGTEEKDISSKGKFNLTLGAAYEPTDRFEIKAELSLIPAKGSVDYGLALGMNLSF